MHVSIITHKGDDCLLTDYQTEWDKIATELPGAIKITTVSFADHPDVSPIHDRWWVLYDVDEDVYLGLRSASLSTMGSRETEISTMNTDDIKNVNELWSKYVEKKPKRVDGRGIVYDEIVLKSH